MVRPISDRLMCVAVEEAHAIGNAGETYPSEQPDILEEPYVGATVMHDELNITLHYELAWEPLRIVVHG